MGSSQFSMANLLITIPLWLHPLLVSGSEINCDEGGREKGPAVLEKCLEKLGHFGSHQNGSCLNSNFWMTKFLEIFEEQKFGWPSWVNHYCQILGNHQKWPLLGHDLNCWLPNNTTIWSFLMMNSPELTDLKIAAFETRDKWFKWWLANQKI